jgi:hypothetical protein
MEARRVRDSGKDGVFMIGVPGVAYFHSRYPDHEKQAQTKIKSTW